jgi:hypothetical protein
MNVAAVSRAICIFFPQAIVFIVKIMGVSFHSITPNQPACSKVLQFAAGTPPACQKEGFSMMPFYAVYADCPVRFLEAPMGILKSA